MPTSYSRRGVLAGATAVGVTAAASRVPASVQATPDEPPDPVGDDLESFVDDAIDSALQAHNVSGAVVSVVHDGAVALERGYGETSFDGRAVTPDETPVHTGSVSKAATYTAAMRLIDDDAIDPDADVNQYLESVSVPETFDEPITLSHLATHTAGFEPRMRNDTVENPDDRQPLAESVGTHQPSRLRPPGEVMGYTNYAPALTGQVIADVADIRFADYVDDAIFDPLGMDRTTFDVIPSHVDDETREGIRRDLQFHSNVEPASGMWSTGSDMAQFLLAHLEGGATDTGRMLSEDAATTMHKQSFAPHEELERMAFGLFVRTRDDIRLLYHGGGGMGYHSQFLFIPELDLGLFVSFQGAAPELAVSEFEDEFLERYVPTTDTELTPDGQPHRADELEGSYRAFMTHELTTYEKTLFSGTSPGVDIWIDDDGTLVVDGSNQSRWVELEPLVFRRVDGQATIVFHETDGEITDFTSDSTVWTYTRISWYDDLYTQVGLGLGSALVVLSGVLGWPLAAAVRRVRGEGASPTDSSTPHRARLIAGGAGALLVGVVIALFALEIVLSVLGRGSLMTAPPSGLSLAFTVPMLAAIATVVAAGYAVQAWRESYWGVAGRIHYTAVVLALAVLCWVFRYWNLMGLPV
ncbi:beta-lactamase family protein [Natronolimnobius sp. AArcel1]|uniref:serine hydrolase domain-containing protein n=1 Tax=Natronolimnobius sp. AArcel1 TaxID=1679093 RepID=UPI0013ED2867|nr:serine hydrolase domain-containing protein [Natronolimnobius sp. AArcel1]NGM71003.1 beta-lactamase family protein [Natronolimnobius sp. AArcel1]